MYLYFFIGVLAIVVFGGVIMALLSFFKKTATSGISAATSTLETPSAAPAAAAPAAAAAT